MDKPKPRPPSGQKPAYLLKRPVTAGVTKPMAPVGPKPMVPTGPKPISSVIGAKPLPPTRRRMGLS